MAQEPDDVYMLRSRFFCGHYTLALEEAEHVDADNEMVALLRDVYVYRSHLAMERYEVLDAIAPDADPSLLLLQAYAQYKAEHVSEQSLMETIDSLLQQPSTTADAEGLGKTLAGMVYLDLRHYKDCLTVCHGQSSLEALACSTLSLLAIHRPDLASKCVEQMSSRDDDDVLTQLMTVHVSIASQGRDVEEAGNIVRELMEKFGPSVHLLELLGATLIRLRSYADAINALKEARALSKEESQPTGETTLLNSILCTIYLEPQMLKTGPKFIQMLHKELGEVYPGHPFFEQNRTLEQQFDQCASRFAV